MIASYLGGKRRGDHLYSVSVRGVGGINLRDVHNSIERMRAGLTVWDSVMSGGGGWCRWLLSDDCVVCRSQTAREPSPSYFEGDTDFVFFLPLPSIIYRHVLFAGIVYRSISKTKSEGKWTKVSPTDDHKNRDRLVNNNKSGSSSIPFMP